MTFDRERRRIDVRPQGWHFWANHLPWCCFINRFNPEYYHFPCSSHQGNDHIRGCVQDGVLLGDDVVSFHLVTFLDQSSLFFTIFPQKDEPSRSIISEWTKEKFTVLPFEISIALSFFDCKDGCFLILEAPKLANSQRFRITSFNGSVTHANHWMGCNSGLMHSGFVGASFFCASKIAHLSVTKDIPTGYVFHAWVVEHDDDYSKFWNSSSSKLSFNLRFFDSKEKTIKTSIPRQSNEPLTRSP